MFNKALKSIRTNRKIITVPLLLFSWVMFFAYKSYAGTNDPINDSGSVLVPTAFVSAMAASLLYLAKTVYELYAKKDEGKKEILSVSTIRQEVGEEFEDEKRRIAEILEHVKKVDTIYMGMHDTINHHIPSLLSAITALLGKIDRSIEMSTSRQVEIMRRLDQLK